MNWKRFLVVLPIVCVVIILFDYIYNFIFLQEAFMKNSQYWRTPEQMKSLIILGWIVMVLCITIISLLFIQSGKTGIYNGLKFGFLTGLLLFLLVYGFTTIVPWPACLLIAWAGQWFANSIILGFLFGWLYKKKGSALKR